ncbi:zinc finger protein 69 homolog [Culicoides brevitarsis]|uniref:zinc finger protein 69 homolog n=1 Tax=Culicoides brevitarsis TaxID=469753 RepID=UPI00307B829C
MKCQICLTESPFPRYPLDLISAKIFKDLIEEIFHMQIFPQNDTEMSVCPRCEEKLHEINDFYRMVLRCHSNSMLDHGLDFLQELREDEIQTALDLFGIDEFESFSMEHHVTSETPEIVEEKFVCDICGKIFDAKDVLEHHMMLKHLKNSVSCEICGKQLSPSSVYLHQKTQHSFVEGLKCDICGVFLKHERSLKEHLKKFHHIAAQKKAFHRICSSCVAFEMSLPVHQHVIIECDHHQIHSLSSLELSGFTEEQWRALTEHFQIEKKQGTYSDFYRASAHKVKRESQSITDLLNYLSHNYGFVLVTVTFSNHKNQFVLRRETFRQNL